MKFPAVFNVDHLDGKNGFTLTSSNQGFGASLAGTGDINGDGKNDLIVGAYLSNKSYVIFGTTAFPAIFDILHLNGNNGFTLTSSSTTGFGGPAVGTGDINGDGKPDLIVGDLSKAYVIFGANHFPATFDVSSLNGSNGFTLISSSSGFGSTLSGVGDINGDGKPDLIVGAWIANKAYVIFGANHFPAIFDVSSLNGSNGFTLTSSTRSFGYSAAGAGDVNGDNIPDFIVGTSDFRANKAYVIFGAFTFPATFDISSLNGSNGFTLTSYEGNFGDSVDGTGDVNGDSKSDLIVGLGSPDGNAYVIFGASTFPTIIDMSSLNGTNGFKLTASTNGFGCAVSGIGDVNGDNIPDLSIGAEYWNENKAYVIFGQTHQNYDIVGLLLNDSAIEHA